jgi:hypothetical protein
MDINQVQESHLSRISKELPGLFSFLKTDCSPSIGKQLKIYNHSNCQLKGENSEVTFHINKPPGKKDYRIKTTHPIQ